MKHRWAACVVMLALGAIMPRSSRAQGTTLPRQPANSERSSPGFQLGQNYPNPFNPTTTIPFTIGDAPACSDGKAHVVTLRIFNVLGQVVAIPILQGGPVAAGQPVASLRLSCGSYTAYWNGNDATGRQVASGVYVYVIEVDGSRGAKKMLVMK
jgi:hypothetical protein